MICPQCQQAELAVNRENHHYLESGLSNVTLSAITVRRCPNFRASFPSIPRLAERHRTIALRLVRKAEGLVPTEIRWLHKHLGWAGADFARKFHGSPS
jgi:hypothetical protein